MDVPVDISDCMDSSVPENTFRFTKLPSDLHDLLPNPFLLEHRRAPQHPIKWKHKKDSLYFRALLQGNCNHSKTHVLQLALQHKGFLTQTANCPHFPKLQKLSFMK